MTARTVNGSIKIREKHKIFKETGSPFDTTPIHSIKVCAMNCLTSGKKTNNGDNRSLLRGKSVVGDAHEVHLCSDALSCWSVVSSEFRSLLRTSYSRSLHV